MHKRIGILGGVSPESTAEYYQYITRMYTRRFGNYAYPEILIYSVSFQSYVDWPSQNRWDRVAQGLSEAAQALERAGADFLVIAANTMHLVYDQVQASVQIPVLSLLDAVTGAIHACGFSTVGLLGTRFTMDGPLYTRSLGSRGITVLLPEAEEREWIDRVIYTELVAGQFREESRQGFIRIVRRLAERGAQGIILGCTEIPLLLHAADVRVPLFDTTQIHAEAALQYALASASGQA